ncbi:hypothetical protein PaeCFBP13512_18460 [Paenibacillus sp. CFBP13512]|uniref:hypothetical protein n=1 Tax=Paenibacillus sp. CFBP13512 TaxID=2184007 RepID=UPI0010C08511|nr:hypothetical protein [Paenibacillus sp. CFBP13512]TKJ87206.1 hypothetical protein PaeCFBP13512_18460 [Paenibacillus sp. CFBP13512]
MKRFMRLGSVIALAFCLTFVAQIASATSVTKTQTTAAIGYKDVQITGKGTMQTFSCKVTSASGASGDCTIRLTNGSGALVSQLSVGNHLEPLNRTIGVILEKGSKYTMTASITQYAPIGQSVTATITD